MGSFPGVFRVFLSLSLLLSSGALRAAEESGRAAEVFKQLSSLVGTWTGTYASGRAHSVNYRLTANGSVLVETWTLGAGRESMTLYHLDGDSLLAHHFCPQGNQPRLALQPAQRGQEPRTGAEKYSFVFRDGTNLQVKGKSHQHFMWIRVNGKDSFERAETYIENGSKPDAAAVAKMNAEAEVVKYVRVSVTAGGAGTALAQCATCVTAATGVEP